MIKIHDNLYDACQLLLISLSDSIEEAENMKKFFQQSIEKNSVDTKNKLVYNKNK